MSACALCCFSQILTSPAAAHLSIQRKERAIEALAKKYAFGEGALQRVKKFWCGFGVTYWGFF